MNPLISIIVPVYQVEKYIENCMLSICNQSFKDFEIILVNDGTKDKSIEIAERILIGERMNYTIILQPNMGLSSARNNGIKASNGSWVVCVDSDDILNEDFLKTLIDTCKQEEANVVIGGYQVVSELDLFKKPNELYSSVIIEQWEIMHMFLVRKIKIIAPAILISKNLIETNDLWYDKKIQYSEDQHFIWRLLLSSEKIAYNRTPIYNYYVRANSIMTSSNINKILTGYNAFVEFTKNINYYKDSTMKEKILDRWVLGAMGAATRMMGYKEFKILSEEINYREHFKSLLTFPEFRARMLSLIALLNLKIFYLVNSNR